MRVFIGPNEVTGQYRNLAIALRAIGVSCDYFILNSDNLKYGGDIGNSRLPAIIRRLDALRKNRQQVLRWLISILIEIVSIMFMFRCAVRYDVFLFGFGCSFLRHNIDLPLLKLFGKKIVVNLSHGSDMRPPYIDGALLDDDMKMPGLDILFRSSVEKRNKAKRLEKYANFIIGSPISSSFFLNKSFVNLFQIGRVSQGFRHIKPMAPAINDAANLDLSARAIRIVHAPSHAPGKGSIIIKEIIFDLIEKGYKIDFVEISGKSNDAVIAELRSCDLVVDQVYADLPMSGLAAEAACFGKPTLIAGYDLIELKMVTPTDCFPPILVCSPEEMYSTLNYLLDHPEQISLAGRVAQSFVYNKWSESSVALRYLALFQNKTIPKEWWHDPKSMIFLHGYEIGRAHV